MELFFTNRIDGETAYLDTAESNHCIKVLRYSVGEIINFTDGQGTLYKGEIISNAAKEVIIQILERASNYMRRNYYLHMAVAPPKNPVRFEWFLEKAVELGIDEITPLECEHSQRRSFNHIRGEKIILSAMKQSLKTILPKLNPMTRSMDVIAEFAGDQEFFKLFGHCREGDKRPINELLSEFKRGKIIVLIGPEGDFSIEEIKAAQQSNFNPFSLGESRLRTETAALTVVSAVYLN